MSKKSITLCHIYPEILNLCGDAGNVAAIKDRCEKRGIEFIEKKLSANMSVDFSDIDIVIFGGGTDRAALLVSEYRDTLGSALKEYVENDGVLLALCSGYQLLGNYYEYEGRKIEGFGVLDVDTKASDKRFIGNVAIEVCLGDEKVILAGFENHAGYTDIKGHSAFGKVMFGYGNDGAGNNEGVIYKNTVATYVNGPILPKNPELTDFLIKAALKRKYPCEAVDELEKLDDMMEKRAREYIINREITRGK